MPSRPDRLSSAQVDATMPIYPYRCRRCGTVTELLWSGFEPPEHVTCGACEGETTYRVIGVNAYHRSDAQKTARLDPKYDNLVDATAKAAAATNEDRLLRRMKPFK